MSEPAPLLGQSTGYTDEYDPGLLRRIVRVKAAGCGMDIWNLWELTWLDARGLPQAACGRLTVPASSPCMVESKSLKLYLGSFAMTRLSGAEELRYLVLKDLEPVLGCRAELEIVPPGGLSVQDSGTCYTLLEDHAALKELPPGSDVSGLLTQDENSPVAEQALCTHLIRALCPVTGQPDLGSMYLRYSGRRADYSGLISYITAQRRQRRFHEQFADMLFQDLCRRLSCTWLWLALGFTRRGGIDIMPVRHTDTAPVCGLPVPPRS